MQKQSVALLLSVLLNACGVNSAAAGWPVAHSSTGGSFFSYGNHRFVASVESMPPPSGLVRVSVPWRRHDTHPELKDTVIVDAETHIIVQCMRLSASVEQAEFVFHAASGPGRYNIYYVSMHHHLPG